MPPSFTKRTSVALICMICTLYPFFATASGRTKFSHISVENGLSQSTVFCILQDHEGFMWFGTRSGGLNRYDGNDFTVFKHNPNDTSTLSKNEVISIFQDHQKRLWIGTRKGGLNLYNPNNQSFKRYYAGEGGGHISGNTVNAIFEDSKKRLWIGTNSGLSVLINRKFRHHFIPKISTQHITSIQENEEGQILICDKAGLYIFDGKDTKYYTSDIDKPALSGNYTTPLFCDAHHNIWLGSTEGVLQFKANKIQKAFAQNAQNAGQPDSETRSIMEDSKGNMWFGTLTGLYKYNPKTHTHTRYSKNENDGQSLSHNSVYSIYEDRSGIIWIGTWGGGVNILSDKLFRFDHYKHQHQNSHSLSNNSVSSFAQGKNGIWVGTELGGVNFWDRSSSKFKAYLHDPKDPKSLSSNHVKTVYMSQGNKLWVGTYGGGLNLFDPKTDAWERHLSNTKVFSISEHPKGTLWIGTLNGLYKYNELTHEYQVFHHDPNNPHSISHDFVNVIYTSANHTLWLGTKEAGLMRYDDHQKHFIRYSNIPHDTTSILSNYVVTLSEDVNNNLLIGTSNGLNMFNPTNQTFIEIAKGKLPDLNVNGVICDDDGTLWISTNKGVTKFDQNKNYIHYNLHDGLQSNEFNRNAAFKDQAGNIFFGGINGFNVFNPKRIPVNKEVPSIVISGFKISNETILPTTKNSPLKQPISQTKYINLNHKENDISFEFVALNYLVSDKNQYAYKLDGYNSDWIYCGKQRVVNYTNLKPGHYTFRVKGSNNDNVWNHQGAKITFDIQPPFWKTPMAYLLYFGTMVLILFVFRQIITIRIKQQNMLENERLEKQRIEEMNQLKLRFFTNVAHEFRTPLSLISGPLSELKTKYAGDAKQTYLIDLAQNNTNRLLHLVNELLDFRRAGMDKVKLRISKGNLHHFLKSAIQCFDSSVAENNIKLSLDYLPRKTSDMWFDPSVLDKIVFNLLSNAIKHTHPNGEVRLKVEEASGWVNIRVIDTGDGIPQEELGNIFERFYQVGNKVTNMSGTGIGLAFVKRLTKAHLGTINVSSTVGEGTTFVVHIPVSKQAFSNDLIVDEAPEHSLSKNSYTERNTLSPSRKASVEHENIKLLIVEDNLELCSFLAHHFNAFEVLTAHNGKEGLDVATKELPDLIVSDVMMPVMDGLELCRQSKKAALTSHIPVVLLSARAEVSQKIEGLEVGADAYVAKPFEPAYLEATVRAIIEQRRKLRRKYLGDTLTSKTHMNGAQHEQKFISEVKHIIQKNLHQTDFTVETLAKKLNMSRSQLFRKFKSICEVSPSETIRIERLAYAKKKMLTRAYNINEISDMAGFSSTSYFITSFKKQFGLTPNEYLKMQK